MLHLLGSRLEIFVSEFDVGDRLLLLSAVGVVNVGPDTFNVVRIVKVLNDVNLTILDVACGEVIIALSLPDSEGSVSHSNVVVLLVNSQSGNEVPGLILAIKQSLRVGR